MKALAQLQLPAPVRQVRFSSGGEYLSLLFQSGTIMVLSCDPHQLLGIVGGEQAFSTPGKANGVAFIANTHLAISDSHGGIYLFPVVTSSGARCVLPEVIYGPIVTLSDSSLIGMRSFKAHGRRTNGLELISLQTGIALNHCFRSDTAIALHPEGHIIGKMMSFEMGSEVSFVSLHDATFQLRDCLFETELALFGIAFSPDGEKALVTGMIRNPFAIEVVQFPSCALLLRKLFDFPHFKGGTILHYAERAAFTPDSESVLCPLPTGKIARIEIATGLVLDACQAHEGPITSIDVHPRLGLLASCSVSGDVRLWDLDQRVSVLQTPRVTNMFLASCPSVSSDDEIHRRQLLGSYTVEELS